MFAVVAAEAAGKVLVADVVLVTLPRDVHKGKLGAIKDLLQCCDRVPHLRIAASIDLRQLILVILFNRGDRGSSLFLGGILLFQDLHGLGLDRGQHRQDPLR